MQGVRHVERLSTKEARLGLAAGVDQHGSWHDEYRGSAYIFVGGVARGLNEGDLVAVFSQYGRVVRVNLVRDRATGESRGYAFLCYEDERSTVLAVDNFNGITLAGRVIQFVQIQCLHGPVFTRAYHLCFCVWYRVNHVKQYRKKKDSTDLDEGVVPERPELSNPANSTEEEEDGDSKGTAAAAAATGAPSAVERERATAAGEGDEDATFEMDAELEALEEKIQRAERRLAKWDRKYARACRRSQHHHHHSHSSDGDQHEHEDGEDRGDEGHESISAEEYARERRHIEHVLRKLQQRQESLWARAEQPPRPAP